MSKDYQFTPPVVRTIALAVLTQAIRDAQSKSMAAPARLRRKEAREWLLSTDILYWLELLNNRIKPEDIRNWVNQLDTLDTIKKHQEGTNE